MSDLKSKILEAQDRKFEKVFIKEWDTDVYVGPMTGKDKDKYDESISELTVEGARQMNLENFRAKLLVHVLYEDPEGKVKIFNEEDADELGKKSYVILEKLWNVAKKMNGMDDEEVQKK